MKGVDTGANAVGSCAASCFRYCRPINTPAAIHNLELVYLLGPIFFVMLGGACYIGYKLDSKRHAEIRAALDERDAMTPQALAQAQAAEFPVGLPEAT